ncbi:hypothetical protein RIF29_42111 [Crotalaria pallida]|uniref:Uncharacterized protein n=1 Tax=Crotalaria pallida TaxID=3830 RepID=A0AAN9HVZ7_CROPI
MSSFQLSLSSSSLRLRPTFSLYTNIHSSCSRKKKKPSPSPSPTLLRLPPLLRSSSSSFTFNPLLINENMFKSTTCSGRTKGFGAVCYAAPFTPHNLHLISTISSVVLILARGTPVQKSFIVPFFALQAPASVVSWIRGRYGLWSAFLALLVRLFVYIPGELELPFLALLLVIVAPYEALNLRGTKEGAIISSLIAVYLAYQHFSRTSLQKSVEQGSIVATIAVTVLTVASLETNRPHVNNSSNSKEQEADVAALGLSVGSIPSKGGPPPGIVVLGGVGVIGAGGLGGLTYGKLKIIWNGTVSPTDDIMSSLGIKLFEKSCIQLRQDMIKFLEQYKYRFINNTEKSEQEASY